jgi:hypothetical protein
MSADDFQDWLDGSLHALITDRGLPAAELLSAYESLEEEAIQRLSSSADEQRTLEVKRELALLRLVAAKQRGVDAVNARLLLARCEQVGYSSPDARLNAAAIFARICLGNVRPDLEHGELEAALQDLPGGKYPSIEQLAKDLRVAKGLPPR